MARREPTTPPLGTSETVDFAFARAAKKFDSISDLKAQNMSAVKDEDRAIVLGVQSINDNGGGYFYYDADSSDTEEANKVIAPDSGGGRWIRLDSFTKECANIEELISSRGWYDDQQIKVNGFYTQDDGGGGEFYWASNESKSKHNGGTVIDPDHTSTPGGSGWYSSQNTGSGCWVRPAGDTVNARWFGAKGDDTNDDQPAIQASIDVAGKRKVMVPEGEYRVGLNQVDSTNKDTCLILKDNTHLSLYGATLKLFDSEEATQYVMLGMVGVSDVLIEGGKLIGNKHTSTATTGEQGHALSLDSVDGVIIRDVESRENWGDGLWVGRYGGGKSRSSNVTIKNCLFDDNRRQGMSVISVNGLYVENCRFNNTGGTPPEAGIDIEPNNSGEVLQNIVMKGIECNNNAGAGLTIYPTRLESASDHNITISVKDFYSEGCGTFGFGVTSSFNTNGVGYIKLENAVVKNNQTLAAYYFRNWHKDAPPILLKDIVAINPNTGGSGGTTQGSALVFYDSDGTFDQGNLHVDGFEVLSDPSATGQSPEQLYTELDLFNCSFKNIKCNWNTIYNAYLLDAEKGNDIQVIGSNLSKSETAGFNQHNTRHIDVIKNNPNADSDITTTARAGDLQPFRLVSQGSTGDAYRFQISAPSGEVFYPTNVFGTQTIRLSPSSNTEGSSIEIQRINGRYVVLHETGNWASV